MLGGPDDAIDETTVRALAADVDASKDVETSPITFFVPASEGGAKAPELRVLGARSVVKGLVKRAAREAP